MTETAESRASSPASRELGTWKTVRATVENGIAWVVLNRPDKRNCMSPTLNDEMLDVLDTVSLDSEARVLVLTGAGEAFSAGMDLKEFFRDTDALSQVERDIVQRSAFEWQGPRLRKFPLPTIAMVNGYCFGGAFLPMSNCDIAVAADDATFGLSEVNWGIIPGGNVPLAVVHTMTPRAAMYYSITGETFDGRTAAATGLVTESVPRDNLRARVLEIAEMLKSKNTTIVRGTKETIRHLRSMGWTEGENYINAKFAEALFSDTEGGRAKGLRQFLDEKSIRPGLEAYRA
ncbi:p-hydroxycinnamoyl CoA hydratase/lyase [Nocardia cyriacigeorgica]|uniref:p-hydroxycinnamoyl CoA hydratase/lyase n=1 Tax=Nocardia cyriacigeorgica TaxID=135487 RepID=A0A6P1CU07_9NOCA|nr:p-hydroxycinnamoyl CoA hydratase/lyase [Nocardia cyriacigeorgica]NEW36039.1 p-hydroxycinnamoyl CoA hydratase/lyase [Nocardia cyriacigeorgica]